MNEDTAIEIIREYLETQFPKKCQGCGMVFSSLAEYIKNTSKMGDPVSFDVEMNEWESKAPLGTYIFAKCKCGSTLNLSLKDMEHFTKLRLTGWVLIKASKRGLPAIELFRHLRSEIRCRALNEYKGNGSLESE